MTGPSSDNLPRQTIGDMPVRVYGPYFLVRKVAEGGMAEIFLAKQVGEAGFEKNVVVKRMLPHLSSVSDFVAMFLDEARLAASLSHPNIVHITDLGMADGCYFICMEYLAGEDFSTVVRTARRRNTQVPLHVVLRVITQAAAGLHYAHTASDPSGQPMNLVHRDISPSNLFITYSGQVKVLDFGIAKAESRVTNTTAGVVKGKYQYMSPEQAKSDAVDARSDVFSLGVSTYEALTGVRPFARDTDLAILKALLSGDYQPLRQLRPDLPPEIEAVVRKMMALDPNERYGSALEVVHDIERFLSATTSASGGQLLSDYMTSFFGQERVLSRTRIETLDQLAARGVDVPGRGGTKKAEPATLPAVTVAGLKEAEDPTRAIDVPSAIMRQREQGRRKVVLALSVVAALAVGGGLSFGVLKALRSAEPTGPTPVVVPPPGAVDAAVAIALPLVIDAGPSEALDAGTALAAVDAGEEDVPGPKQQVRPPRPVVLTTAMVQRGVSNGKARIQKCFRDNRDELPAAQGTLKLQFTIASTGKVSAATTDLPGTQVSRCVETVVKSLPFPRHVDQEVRVPIALAWDVR